MVSDGMVGLPVRRWMIGLPRPKGSIALVRYPFARFICAEVLIIEMTLTASGKVLASSFYCQRASQIFMGFKWLLNLIGGRSKTKSFIAQKIEDIKKVFQNACEKIEWHANKRVDKYEFDGQTWLMAIKLACGHLLPILAKKIFLWLFMGRSLLIGIL